MKLDTTAYAHGGTRQVKYSANDVERCACPLCGADDQEPRASGQSSAAVVIATRHKL